ncbi:MAG TPA: helix-turn-helix domain-containing protein [Actinomycetota bacterium]|jgi:predicted ArsR family transcriptional regulator|nr:helix-turn-helix domain-containing protein [Actinomycetota bacterium]
MAADGFDTLYETARALGEETRFRIYRQLSLSGHAESVAELARSFDLHPNAVRQHLARLEQAGLVVSSLDRSSGAGRPPRLYESSQEPLELSHPPRTLKPLVRVLSHVVDALPTEPSHLRELGRAWGRTWATQRRAGNGAVPRSRKRRAELLARLLAEWGWQPSSRNENGRVRISTGRCLFHDLVPERDGRCCALEEGLLSGLVETMLNGHAEVMRLPGCRLEIAL